MRNSNWGRWGADDERGTLNMLTDAHVGQATRIPTRGKVYSLGAPVGRDGPIGLRNTTHHYMSRILNDPSPGGTGSADDVLVTHCHASTHLDGLCHIWYDSQLYNGHSASEVTPGGALRCGVQNVDWIITRGVLLDIAALKGVTRLENDYAVTGDDLDGAAKARGVDIRPGDVVLFRTGWYSRYLEGTADLRGDYPGLSASAAEWITAHDLCAIGADNVAVEIWPPAKTRRAANPPADAERPRRIPDRASESGRPRTGRAQRVLVHCSPVKDFRRSRQSDKPPGDRLNGNYGYGSLE